ncbi:MAG: protein TolR [Immundisolibacteraceae bacterium]|nr:protein TolR [Immundisolibacteraceae bacterium]
MTRRSRRHRRGGGAISQINVVPYIDVMLVLLIIFMITTPLLETGVEVNLPKTVAAPMEYKGSLPLVVTVDKGGDYFLDFDEYQQEAVDEQRLLALVTAIKSRHGDLKVMVKGDELTAYGNVVRVMALLQSAGVGNVGLLTDSPDANNAQSAKKS